MSRRPARNSNAEPDALAAAATEWRSTGRPRNSSPMVAGGFLAFRALGAAPPTRRASRAPRRPALTTAGIAHAPRRRAGAHAARRTALCAGLATNAAEPSRASASWRRPCAAPARAPRAAGTGGCDARRAKSARSGRSEITAEVTVHSEIFMPGVGQSRHVRGSAREVVQRCCARCSSATASAGAGRFGRLQPVGRVPGPLLDAAGEADSSGRQRILEWLVAPVDRQIDLGQRRRTSFGRRLKPLAHHRLGRLAQIERRIEHLAATSASHPSVRDSKLVANHLERGFTGGAAGDETHGRRL